MCRQKGEVVTIAEVLSGAAFYSHSKPQVAATSENLLLHLPLSSGYLRQTLYHP